MTGKVRHALPLIPFGCAKTSQAAADLLKICSRSAAIAASLHTSNSAKNDTADEVTLIILQHRLML
jgi:hypothetical protein